MSRKFALFSVIIICVFVSFSWYKLGFIIGGGEDGLSFAYPGRSVEYFRPLWHQSQAGGPQVVARSRFPTYQLLQVINDYGVRTDLLQIILFFTLLTITGISFYLLSEELIPERPIFHLTTTLFYLFNPYSFSSVWHRFIPAMFFMQTVLPLSIYLFVKFCRSYKIKYIVLFLISSNLLAFAYSSPSNIITLWAVMLIFAVWLTISLTRENKTGWFPILGLTVFLLGWISTSWWWAQYLFLEAERALTSVFTSEYNLSVLRSISRQYPPSIIFRLAYPGVITGLVNISTFIMTVIVIIGIKNISPKKLKYLFVGLLLVSIFFLNGSHLPTGPVFEWLFLRLSPLQAFRNPYEKFGLVLAFCYSFLFGWGMKSVNRRNKTFSFVLAVFLVLLLIKSLWYGHIFGSNKYNAYVFPPNDYEEVNTVLNKDTDIFRFLDIPILQGDSLSYEWNNGSYYGLQPNEWLFDKPSLSRISRQGSFDQYRALLRKSYFTGNIKSLLSYGNIKYFLVHKDINSIFSGTPNLENTKKLLTQTIVPSKNGIDLPCLKINIPCEVSGVISESNTTFIIVTLTSSISGVLRFDLESPDAQHLVFDGTIEKDYSIKKTEINQPKKFILDLRTPTEKYPKFSLKDVTYFTTTFTPQFSKDIVQASMSSVLNDPGEKMGVNYAQKLLSTPNLELYKIADEFYQPRIYASKNITTVSDWSSLLYIDQYPSVFILADDKKMFPMDYSTSYNKLPKIKFEKTSDLKYIISITNSMEGFWLVFSDSYHPKWNLRSDDAFFPHFIANGFSNGFWINKSGSFQLTLQFGK